MFRSFTDYIFYERAFDFLGSIRFKVLEYELRDGVLGYACSAFSFYVRSEYRLECIGRRESILLLCFIVGFPDFVFSLSCH